MRINCKKIPELSHWLRSKRKYDFCLVILILMPLLQALLCPFIGLTPYWTWLLLCYFASSCWAGWQGGLLFTGTTYPSYFSPLVPWVWPQSWVWTLSYFIEFLSEITLDRRKRTRQPMLSLKIIWRRAIMKPRPQLSSKIALRCRPPRTGVGSLIIWPRTSIESWKEL